MALQWLAVDPTTGEVVAEFPGMALSGSMSVGIGWAENATTRLPLTDRCPRNWKQATSPNRMLLVADNPATGRPLQAFVIRRRKWGSGPLIEIGLQSIENWLNETSIVVGQVRMEETDLAGWLGLQMVVDVFHGRLDKVPTGKWRDRTYEDGKDTKRLEALQRLMRVESGPEWAIFYEWDATGRLVVNPVVAGRIGRAAQPGQLPERHLPPAEWSIDEDASEGKGAPIVQAYANAEAQGGNGEQIRITSERRDETLLAAGYLPTVYRWQPDTGSINQQVIDGYADRKLAEIRTGTEVITMRVAIDELDLGISLDRGDDFLADLNNEHDPDLSRQLVRRMVGWTIEPHADTGEVTHLTPLTLDPGGFA